MHIPTELIAARSAIHVHHHIVTKCRSCLLNIDACSEERVKDIRCHANPKPTLLLEPIRTRKVPASKACGEKCLLPAAKPPRSQSPPPVTQHNNSQGHHQSTPNPSVQFLWWNWLPIHASGIRLIPILNILALHTGCMLVWLPTALARCRVCARRTA